MMIRRQTRLLILLFNIAFFTNAILPVFVLAHSEISFLKNNKDELPSIFGNKILICTVEGLKWISWEDLSNDSEIPDKNKNFKCELCYLSSNSFKEFLVSNNQLKLSSSFEKKYVHSFVLKDNHTKNSFKPSSYFTRAPPKLFLTT